MAFRNLIIVKTTLVAVVFADYNWPFNQGQMPGYNAFQNFGFPHVNLPNPPPLPNFNVHSFPQVPQFDISKVTPRPGEIYNGISVQSSSSVKRDKDGNLIKNGGSTLSTNNNGVVHRYNVGDPNPYNADAKVFSGHFDEPLASDFVQNKNEANSAQRFSSDVSTSSSSFGHSSNVDGVYKGSGLMHTYVNNNGDVEEHSIVW